MPRFINAAAMATLKGGRAAERLLVRFDLADATYGFWTGTGYLDFGGLQYVGLGRLLSVDPITLGLDGGEPLTLHLSAMPEKGLTPDLMTEFEQHAYHQRPATVSRAYFDPDSRALLAVVPEFRGYIDTLPHEETAGGTAELLCNLESRSRDLTRVGHRIRSDVDQRQIKPDDGFFRYAATAGDQTIYWGSLPGKAS